MRSDITVHRLVDLGWLEDLRKHTNCKIYQEPAFMSTSALLDSGFENTDLQKVHCIIQVPAGKGRGVFVCPLSAYYTEYEFLLRRDTAFLVESINQNPNGHCVVKMRVTGMMDLVNPRGGGKMKKSEHVDKQKRSQTKAERRDRFTFKSGDGKFFSSKSEFEQWCKDNNRTVTWIGD